jgi:hypothetical protein
LDGDGKAELSSKITKSRSNIQNNRIIIADLDGDGMPEAVINTSRSNIKNLVVSAGDVTGDGKSELVAGAMVSDGSILSSALRPGDPIPDIDVTIKKKSGGSEKHLVIGENGRIKVIGPDMEPDMYTMYVSTTFIIEDEMPVVIGGKGEEISIDEGGMQKTAGVKQTMETQVLMTDPSKWITSDQVRVAINTSHSNIKNLIRSVDELEQMLNADISSSKTVINNSHSNIKNLRAAAISLDNTLNNVESMEKDKAIAELQNKMAAINMQFLALQQSMEQVSKQYSTISNVLKTKHDTVKNSIGNIR